MKIFTIPLLLSATLIGCGACSINAPVKDSAPTSTNVEQEQGDTCSTCLEVCYQAESADMGPIVVCESECQGGNKCDMHEAKKRAEASSAEAPREGRERPAARRYRYGTDL